MRSIDTCAYGFDNNDSKQYVSLIDFEEDYEILTTEEVLTVKFSYRVLDVKFPLSVFLRRDNGQDQMNAIALRCTRVPSKPTPRATRGSLDEKVMRNCIIDLYSFST